MSCNLCITRLVPSKIVPAREGTSAYGFNMRDSEQPADVADPTRVDELFMSAPDTAEKKEALTGMEAEDKCKRLESAALLERWFGKEPHDARKMPLAASSASPRRADAKARNSHAHLLVEAVRQQGPGPSRIAVLNWLTSRHTSTQSRQHRA